MKFRTKFALFTGFILAVGSGVRADEVVIMPYLQPGDASVLGLHDRKMVLWVTRGEKSDYSVEYGLSETYGQKAAPTVISLKVMEGETHHVYRAELEKLAFNSKVYYRVLKGGQSIRQGMFRTRSKGPGPIRFLVTGDTSNSDFNSRKLSMQMLKTSGDFVVVCGDVAYLSGLLKDYINSFAPCFINPEKPDPEKGAPLLANLPAYFALGNHDVKGFDLERFPDGMAAFYLWATPLNGFKDAHFFPPVTGGEEQVKSFKEKAGSAYPLMANYSFDNGPVHFLVLDANAYVDVSNEAWRSWMERDLMESGAKWKLVFFHQPGFQSGQKHYDEQRMRAFAPLFEKCGVDVVFSGHVHNYQRSKPLKFQPDGDLQKTAMALRSARKVRLNGKFTLDEKYNGITQTSPDGVIYVVTGAGGHSLYDTEMTGKPETWKHELENWQPYTVKFIADRYSFSEVTADDRSLQVRQLDDNGNEVDLFIIRESPRGAEEK